MMDLRQLLIRFANFNRTHSRLLLSLIIALATFVSLPTSAGEIMDRVKAGQPIRVGHSNNQPYSYTLPDGTLTGADIVVLTDVLSKMGITKIEGVGTSFGGLIPALKSNRLDIIATGMYITPDRCKQALFAEPIYFLSSTLIVKSGNPKNLHSLTDIPKDPNLKLGYEVGTAGFVKEISLAGIPQQQQVALPDVSSLIAALKAGRVDATMHSALIASNIIKANPDRTIERATPYHPLVVDNKPLGGIASYVVRTTDQDFLTEFNKHLAALMSTPRFFELIEPFGFTKAELPPPGITTAQVCAGS